ncbi:hypothetical protein PY254_08405 [Rhodanobacter sp. AS-Z3]|uniref:hypothetical protein n=1 Tax=Rhodanobacter sp. AS-Z3 TaxID=3031330 RepID=UPI00247B1CB3|nr:hypothetical protein [Rhodanobacter sp. AS-Z3]WEN16675.1 hypothetical protein PY254_08405 [Rhodanobacter sp. AS-Z3]
MIFNLHKEFHCRLGWRFVLGTLLIVVNLSVSARPNRRVDTHWPASVAQFIERSENCLHFAGEFGGDGSARDAEVNREMDKLRCNSLAADLQSLRQHYRGNVRVTRRLTGFDDDGMPKNTDSGD